PVFFMNYQWEYEQAIGYFNTWSAVQHYIRKNNENPVDEFSKELRKAWGSVSKRKVSFPVFMRVGRK
ncbi:MAG: SAM-dependent methyltransferase, partial [Bacteroidota bacterium]|nr:SAM-dependent methyltransferase [Bacteroidota bacterium]